MAQFSLLQNVKKLKNFFSDKEFQNALFVNPEQITRQKIKNPNVKIYQIVDDKKIIQGIAIFVVSDNDVHHVDVAIAKPFRGKKAIRICKKILQDYAIKTGTKIIFARIALQNKRSLFFARWCGFKVFSKNNDYYLLEYLT